MHKKIVLAFVLIVIVFFACIPMAIAQQPYAFHLNKLNGLPSNSVYSVFQDSKGFIWLATNEGLSMYDGFSYTTFKSDKQTSAPGSCIKEDKMGRIWYENFDGNLYYVDQQRKKLQTIALNPSVGFVPFAITKFHLLVIQKEGVDAYDISNLNFIKTIPIDFANLHHATNDAQNMFFINGLKLYKIDRNLKLTSSLHEYKPNETNKQLYGTNKGFFVVSKYNDQKKIQIFDDELNEISELNATEPQFIQGGSYIDDAYWIHTTKGTLVVDNHNISKTYYPDKSISSVLKDRQNNYWFATTNEGVFIVPNLKNTIQATSDFLPGKIIKLSHHEYLIGTMKGELLKTNHLLRDYKTVYTSPENGEFHYLHLDTLSNMIAFSSNGFSLMDATNFKVTHSVNSAVKEICRMDSTYFAYASSSIYGLFKNPKSGIEYSSKWNEYFTSFPKIDTYFVKSTEGIRARSVVYNKKQNSLYYATNIGLFKVTPTHTTEIKRDENPFFGAKLLLHQEVLYALTTKGNLYKIDENNSFKLLNEKLSIPNFEIKMMKKFNDQLVIVSPQHIHNLNLSNGNHFLYSINISPYEINDILLDEDILYILTNKGIIKHFTTKENTSNATNSQLIINDFQLGNTSIEIDKNKIFNYNQNQIKINFSVLDFGKIVQESVYYNLNNKGWKLISPETRTLEFASLSPGEYSLVFKLGDIIQKQAITFTILSPFWLRWWFFLLCFLILLTLGYVYYKYQISLVSNQLRLLQENVELEKNLSKSVLTSIKSQMNPHFFYNALNTIQAYIFTNDKKNASIYLSKFSKLTRLILEMSEKENINLNEEIMALQLYLDLEKARFDDNYDFKIEIQEGLEKEDIKLPSMLIQPYIENSIKHGLLHKTGEKKLRVLFSQIGDFLEITIDDNGIGRKKSKELNDIKEEKYKSFSTQANAKRIELLNGDENEKVSVKIEDKTDINGNSTGTRVVIKLKLT